MRNTHITYANVVSTLALFLVVAGGTAWAAARITGADVVDQSLNEADIADGSLTRSIGANAISSAKVYDGSLTGADIATGTITGTDIAGSTINGSRIIDGSLVSADIADSTLTGADLAASSISTRELKAPEPWHIVGASGEPQFGSWACDGDTVCEWTRMSYPQVRFSKDPFGHVTLEGSSCYSKRKSSEAAGSGPCADGHTSERSAVFYLPPGYRPSQTLSFDIGGYTTIYPDGKVSSVSDRPRFDGIDFRAG